ncbi:MAG TPA: hypothetical protein DFI00_06930 [Rhodospirillaceae bacterium]|nr:hypothetical protein [Alphaproteobacteria bacterium]OUT42151.1 MAG: hypothetical protein CBB62_07600 [Micavibrio sp. TMED2]HCI47009.1 hypothetical protein [Rhodospirillaceae bacterium]MAS46233.1 hypothetical protein [Alphaproteobacteria bacterium]MAX95582.1 hypothetical protein [Alphaproteobacteria bacterium]|tara:strand:- start:21196 stop:22377 length:1182 start_codon:yes stop_codon:yes gene_type:complete
MNLTQTRSLIAIYGSMFAMGLAFGLVLPTMSIRLDLAGYSPAVIGGVAAMASLSILLAAGKVPALHARFGMVTIIVVSLLGEAITYLLLTQTEHIIAWFVLSFAFGLFNTIPWVMGEVWLNAVIPNGKRGRYMATYAGIWGIGMALGPQIMLMVGADGDGPFYAAALVYLASAIWVFALRKGAPKVEPDTDRSTLRGTLGMIALMPVLVIYAIAGGLAETIIYSMMPVYALGRGYGEGYAAHLITAFAAGGIVLQYVFGWLSDRYQPRLVMTCLLAAGAITALALPLAGQMLWLAIVLCFLFGGMAMSVYTLAITLVGHGIARQFLPTAHALMVMCYTLGGLVGPWLAGIAMQWFQHSAMLWLVAAIFALAFCLAIAPAGRQLVSAKLQAVIE